MGRKASQLIPFLIDALERKKYQNLKFEDPINRTFSLFLPQKSSKLEYSCQFVLKGWFKVRRRRYTFHHDYTEAKQCIEAALRKSDFLELLSKGRKQKRVFRFLDQNEILEKKNLKRKIKTQLKLDLYEGSGIVPSPGSSGYGSGSDHAEEAYEGEESWNFMHGLDHDHKYIKKAEIVIESEIPPSFGNANPPNRTEVLCHNGFNPIEETPGTGTISNYPVEYVDMVTDQRIAIERPIYENGYGGMVTDQAIAVKEETYENESDHMATDQTIAIGRQTYDNEYDRMVMMDQAISIGKQTFETEYDNMVLYQAPIGNNEAETYGKKFGAKESSYWDTLIPFRRTFENPYGNLDLSRPPDYLFSEEEEDPPLQDPDKINFDPPLHNNTRLSDVELNEIFDFVMNSEEHIKKEEILPPTTLTNLDISSHKTKWIKVYECRHVQNLPGMIMLTCEPKMKEFCSTDVTEVDESRPQLIFDQATMELVSKCTIENLQLLSNDYLLVLLKFNEFVDECSLH